MNFPTFDQPSSRVGKWKLLIIEEAGHIAAIQAISTEQDQKKKERKKEYNGIESYFFLLKQIYMNLLIHSIIYARKKINSKGKYARPKPIINYIIKINKKER